MKVRFLYTLGLRKVEDSSIESSRSSESTPSVRQASGRYTMTTGQQLHTTNDIHEEIGL